METRRDGDGPDGGDRFESWAAAVRHDGQTRDIDVVAAIDAVRDEYDPQR
jgi:hypothetical protein